MQKSTYKAAHIANFILDNAKKDNVTDVSILKLLKLVYIFFGWFSVAKNADLFTDRIEAWRYGPVVPSLYYELRKYGKKPIEGRATLYDPFGNEEPKTPTEEDITDKEVLGILKTIWNAYKHAAAEHLIDLTHKKGTPWWDTFDDTPSKEIPKNLIRKYYKDMYNSLD